jgi:hypothetical protein
MDPGPSLRSALLLIVLVLAGCGGSEGEGNRVSYPDDVRENFLSACVAQPGATQGECDCVLEHIEETVPFDEFRRLEEKSVPGEPLTAEEDAKFTDAILACREDD